MYGSSKSFHIQAIHDNYYINRQTVANGYEMDMSVIPRKATRRMSNYETNITICRLKDQSEFGCLGLNSTYASGAVVIR